MPESRPDPGQQFCGGKRFGEVVIRPQVQGSGFFLILVPGGNHQNRSGIPPGPDLCDEIHSVNIRQSQIQKDHIRRSVFQPRQCLLTGFSLLAGIVFFFQYIFQEDLDLFVVFNDQNIGMIRIHVPLLLFTGWQTPLRSDPVRPERIPVWDCHHHTEECRLQTALRNGPGGFGP